MNMEALEEIRLEEKRSILKGHSLQADGRRRRPQFSKRPWHSIVDALENQDLVPGNLEILAPRFRSREISQTSDTSLRLTLKTE